MGVHVTVHTIVFFFVVSGQKARWAVEALACPAIHVHRRGQDHAQGPLALPPNRVPGHAP